MKIKLKPPDTKRLLALLEKHLPLPVHVTPEVSQMLRGKGKLISSEDELLISSVFDSGDTGGIVCACEIEDGKEVVALSLTHLRIRTDHPLRGMVEAYQRDRVKKLSRQR